MFAALNPGGRVPERESALARLGQMEIEELRGRNIMGMNGFRRLGQLIISVVAAIRHRLKRRRRHRRRVYVYY